MRLIPLVITVVALTACNSTDTKNAEVKNDSTDTATAEIMQDSSLIYFEKSINAFESSNFQESGSQLLAGANFLKQIEKRSVNDSLQKKINTAEEIIRNTAVKVKSGSFPLMNLKDIISKTELILAHFYIEKADLSTPYKVYNALNSLAAYLQFTVKHGNPESTEEYKKLLNEINNLLEHSKNDPKAYEQELRQKTEKAKQLAALAQLFGY
jgi:hypothetical protein